jgi:hypothetical protein
MIYSVKRPKEGAWIVKPEEATSKYVTSKEGPLRLSFAILRPKLRPEQR